MTLILAGIGQQIPMKLLNVALFQGNCIIDAEDRLHDVGVTGYLLLVTRCERADPDIRQQAFHFPVAEPRALDAGRGPDAFDRGHASLDKRSGAIRPIERHAPLNSSISAISDNISGVM